MEVSGKLWQKLGKSVNSSAIGHKTGTSLAADPCNHLYIQFSGELSELKLPLLLQPFSLPLPSSEHRQEPARNG